MSMIKTPAEIEIMAEAGQKLAHVLRQLEGAVSVGQTTAELDALAAELLKEVGAKSAFKGYRPHGAAKPYPAVLCVSVNDMVVHGVPGGYVIEDGDLVSVDMGLVHKGMYADAAVTVAVGHVSKEAARLVKATKAALEDGIAAAKPGKTLGDIGAAVEKRIKREGFTIVEELTGHGIGRALHEEPYVFNVGRKGEGMPLRPGMTLAIEPMVAMGKGAVTQRKDDSFATRDGSLAAHFEHTIVITKDGPRILTI